ncbi:hypothetical protein GUA87_15385 [Sneathiella sp. P13V-1]|uniref:helix-turn-helix domain-containing protein n=1 Tax=Sneathiella sp. P13V-1 TaxID=2697366 RepID=UPI00187B1D10|nr:helix-turn-helix transcriptional regulator [Sneathiella sp. P13V-1]MBE7638241.1 hypothetical protein [Sneathiella sp. P13V-1]
MTKKNFGELLGELIYSKRKAIGLTQVQLAEDAYGSTGRTRRISELESGKVINPHPKTIDPIIVTLGISDDELAECAARAIRPPNGQLDLAYSEASTLIENLAIQFEHNNQNATLNELGEFLNAKAKEYSQIKKSILAINAADEKISNIKEAAIAALSEGEYSLVETLLCEAEELQQNEKTLEQIRKQVKIRILRGDNKFLEGDLASCFEMYKAAALYFLPFDQKKMVCVFSDLAGAIYETGRRSLSSPFWVSRKLLQTALESYSLDESPAVFGEMYFKLSLVTRHQAAFSDSSIAQDTLLEGVEFARKSINLLGQSNNYFSLASAKISLGNCLSDLSHVSEDPVLADSACGVFEEAIKFIKSKEKPKELKELLSFAYNGLGAAILRGELGNKDSMASDTQDKAIAAYEEAISTSEFFKNQETWGGSQINLGRLLAHKAGADDIDDKAASFLRIRSIACYLAAVETYPAVQYPDAFAEAHFGLAEVLFSHGLDAPPELYEMYFARAIQSYTQAAEFHGEHSHPAKWAYIQCRLGSVFGNHAKRENAETAKTDIEMAISCFKEGQRVFKEHNNDVGADTCLRNIELLETELSELGNA